MGSPIPILVLAWNKEEVTQACLASIAEVTSLEHRVVLIDNGSKTPYPESDAYDLVRLPENLFIPAGSMRVFDMPNASIQMHLA